MGLSTRLGSVMSHSDVGLLPTLSAGRFTKYLAEASGDTDPALDLYRWNGETSSALFEDIGVVEVALRNSIHEQLTLAFGAAWYSKAELFDDETRAVISRAWSQNHISDLPQPVQPGKLVSTLTFGFWTTLLSRGSHSRGVPPFDQKLSYDELLWKPSLHKAFPGSTGARASVLDVATLVRHARNRVAHHQALAWGVPIIGHIDKVTGHTRRLGISAAHAAVLELASFLDPGLSVWLSANTKAPGCISLCPIPNSPTLRL